MFFFSLWKTTSGLKTIFLFDLLWLGILSPGDLGELISFPDKMATEVESNFTHTQESTVPPRSDSVLV